MTAPAGHFRAENMSSSYASLGDEERQRVRQEVLREPVVQESMEDMKERLRLMKTIVDDTREVMHSSSAGGGESRGRGIALDGAMMGAIFTVILAVIVGASVHAFQNLYHAVLKRFDSRT